MYDEKISIEKVLNSRCSYDFNKLKENRWGIFNHWGIFKKEKLENKKLNNIIECCEVPQYSGGKLLVWLEGEYLYLGFEKKGDSFKEQIMHIESGMQQEAVHLACTATGIGTCIHNLGINGTDHGDKIATARHLIMEAEGSYKGEKFSVKPPGPEAPQIKGRHLCEPKRDGEIQCLPELTHLTYTNKSGSSAGEKEVSQILWAARGRTPHYINNRPWGLTIPTWGGRQKYTEVYIIKEKKLFQYINWRGFFPHFGNPTHDIRFMKNIELLSELEGYNHGIILRRKENTSRALWEIGYMIENMLLQARGLQISFKTKFLKADEYFKLSSLGVKDALVMLLL